MADICHPCLAEDADPEIAPFNDFVNHETPGEDYGWGLCEGCGQHYFDAVGKPACQHEGIPEDEATAAPCDRCRIACGFSVLRASLEGVSASLVELTASVDEAQRHLVEAMNRLRREFERDAEAAFIDIVAFSWGEGTAPTWEDL